ncbi:MAG: aminotransferase class V-fold PLP-dependent enzyme [Pyrinomonadaceae bacterium]
MIYFDNNATTRPAPEVFEAMRPFLEGAFGNPSSAYSFGSEAKKTIVKGLE